MISLQRRFVQFSGFKTAAVKTFKRAQKSHRC